MFTLNLQPLRGFLRTLRLPAVALGLSALLTASYIRGARLEEAQAVKESAFNAPTLHYGDTIPEFSLPDTTGKVWTEQNLLGSWTVLMFVQPSCRICRTALDDLNAVTRESWERWNCKPVAVVSASAMFGTFATCVNWDRKMNLKFPMLVDDDDRWAKHCCDVQRRSPFTVLLDPHGRVRFTFEGFSGDTLRKQVATVIASTRQRLSFGKPAAQFSTDALVNTGGADRSFTHIIRHGWTIVTLARFGCGHCNERAKLISRFRSSRQMRAMLLFQSPYEAIREREVVGQLGIECASDKSTHLANRLGTFGNYLVPYTVIFHNGCLVYAQHGDAVDTDLWTILGAISDNRVAQVATAQ